jgi:hypothetical protein
MVLKSAQDTKSFIDIYGQYLSHLASFQAEANSLQVWAAQVKSNPLYSSILTPQEQSDLDTQISKAVSIVPNAQALTP